jgi:hypothetical protein
MGSYSLQMKYFGIILKGIFYTLSPTVQYQSICKPGIYSEYIFLSRSILIRYGPMALCCGMLQQIQYNNHAKIPIKVLRNFTNAPRYVTNQTLHTDLQIPFLNTAFQERFHKRRTDWHLTPTPCGTNATPRAQQEIKPKIDLRHEQLRRRQMDAHPDG